MESLKNYKIYLSISDEAVRTSLEKMIKDKFVMADKVEESDVSITDEKNNKFPNVINMLVVPAARIPEFKGSNDLDGFSHYVIYNEFDFLAERVLKALTRQHQIKHFSDKADHTGIGALMLMEKSTHETGIELPIIRTFYIKSSRERIKFANDLEEFFKEIEPISGIKSPTLTQYAIEIQEELIMNAIWDANPKYLKLPRTTPIDLEPEEEVKLQWAYNGKDIAISVKDIFGRLDPEVLNKYVNFIFKTGTSPMHKLGEQQISAGLGMFMIMQRANLLSVFVQQGKITDVGVVICMSEKKRAKTYAPKAIDIIVQ